MTLYFGRVAPTEPQKEQVNGGGWAWRYQVRIIDKHTQDKNILKDEDLPWAQVLLPVTAGSGAANYAVSPAISQGDTVSIAYLDPEETQPIITGILPRTEEVSKREPDKNNGYKPTTGYTKNRGKNSKTSSDESNQSNKNSQPSTRSDRFSPSIGKSIVLTDTCNPGKYRSNSIIVEINNLFTSIQKYSDDLAYIETLIVGTVDRIHSIVNSYVGAIFDKVFEDLVPILNRAIRALYRAIYAKVLAITGSPLKARLAAEAALIALMPLIQALQAAISEIANKITNLMLRRVDDLVRDAVKENEKFTQCAGTQFAGALGNTIIDEVDKGITPLLKALFKVLSGGYDIVDQARSTADVFRDFGGGLMAGGQGTNKCSGLIREYAFGIGPRADVGDVLDSILETANEANAIVESALSAGEAIDEFTRTFGDFPFLSTDTEIGKRLDNKLRECSLDDPSVCLPPEVILFGGRGVNASAVANVGRYVASQDERTITDVQGGVISIEVINGGSGYVYPPFVDIRDNCGLGIGAVARSVIENGSVVRIYIVDPGAQYPALSQEVFLVGDVVVVEGGFNYPPGRVIDNFGNSYQVVVNNEDDGTVVAIIPETLVPVTDIPVISFPPIVDDDGEPIVVDPETGEPFEQPNGIIYKPTLVRSPTALEIINGDIPPAIVDRINQQSDILERTDLTRDLDFVKKNNTKIANVVDCVED